MVQSKGWDWENANQSAWLNPTEDSYYLSQVWKEKGYSKLLDLGTGLGHMRFILQRMAEYCSLDLHNRHKRMYYYVNAVYSPAGQ